MEPVNTKVVGLFLGTTGIVATIDTAPLLTIFFSILIALIMGWLSARVALKDAKKEIETAFAGTVEQLKAQHSDHLKNVIDDRLKPR